MGRCCSLFPRSTCRNPLQIAPTAIGLPYTYSTIPYANIYIQYILLPRPTCFSVPTPLASVTVSLVYSVYPLNWSCLYHVLYLLPDVCIYIMYIYQMQAVHNTCCFPSPSATQPSPIPPFQSPPGQPQADGSPLMCRGSA